MKGFALFRNLIIAFIPSAVIGLALNHWIKGHLFNSGPVLAATFLGGLYMLFFDKWRMGKFSTPRYHGSQITIDEITPLQALFIGCLQCFSLWPGTSRSMMTITGGLMIGLKPKQAAEFSFLLGLPTLVAATCYDLYKNLHTAHKEGTPNLFQSLDTTAVIVGVLVAAISAALAVKWLVGFLNRRGLSPFGWYRIALTIVMGILIFNGRLNFGAGNSHETKGTTLIPPIKFVDPGKH